MIERAQGDLLKAQADALVNTVNCVGVMGKGLALQFKQAYPDLFRAYAQAARKGGIRPGEVFVYETRAASGPRVILNFPTKRHWRDPSLIADIEDGLRDLVARVRSLGLSSVAIPPLGAGNGGLAWSEVRPRIVEAFEALPEVRVLLFEPAGEPAPEERIIRTERPGLTTARALLLKLMDLYQLPGYAMTLLELQKLSYFLQAAGEPLRLSFVKAPYGPYADNLNHVLRRLEGHYLLGATDTRPNTALRLLPEAAAEAERLLAPSPEATARLARVAGLIEGFETPYGMELLATVHWVMTREGADASGCVAAVRGWNRRKAEIMSAAHIQTAIQRLQEEGFLG